MEIYLTTRGYGKTRSNLYYKYRKISKSLLSKRQLKEAFTFNNYKQFCKDFSIKESDYNNLKIFKMYCRGRYEVLLSIL